MLLKLLDDRSVPSERAVISALPEFFLRRIVLHFAWVSLSMMAFIHDAAVLRLMEGVSDLLLVSPIACLGLVHSFAQVLSLVLLRSVESAFMASVVVGSL